MVSSTVHGMKQTFQAIAPEYLTARGGQTVVKGEGGTIGQFMPGHLPGDTYIDKDKTQNMQRLLASHKNFSHKPFITSLPPTDVVKNGALDGTFSKLHGGFPHMFENLAPEKSGRWLGKIDGKMVNPMPVLVNGCKMDGPGFPTRTIGGEPRYESEFNNDQVEKLNRQLRLGYGPGFRVEEDKSKRKGEGAMPWKTGRIQPDSFDKDGTAFKKTADDPNMAVSKQYVAKYVSRAAALAARANHSSPFISATSERKLPNEVFGTFGYVPEPYIDDTYKHYDSMVKKRSQAKGIVSKFTQPPFRASGKTVTAKTQPSVMFRSK